MPLYMDIHVVPGATPKALEEAHNADLAVQDKHCVHCLKYWFNVEAGKVFCLFDAPNAEAAAAVHREAHGLMAEKIIEVDADMADGLLGPAEVNSAGAALLPNEGGQQDPGVRAVMFTDMVGSTEMTSRYGDDAALAMLRVHDRVVRDALRENNGREVKHTGDGIMAAFFSAVCAVRAACQMQAALRDHEGGEQFPVAIRVGISAGEPVEDHDDLFGSTVQLAARLCAQAEPGQILVSDVIAGLCIGKGLRFSEAGMHELKGFDRPVETHLVEILC